MADFPPIPTIEIEGYRLLLHDNGDGTFSWTTTGGGGGGADVQYVDGVIQVTPTGTVALGKNPSNVLHSVALDASGNLLVNVAAGGTSGVQFADNAASGTTPTGTLSMGWDSANSKIRALKVDTGQNLLVAISGTVPVSGTVAVTQSTSPWVVSNGGTFAVQEATLDAALIAQEATTSGVKGLTAFGAVTTNAPSYTTLKSDALSLDTSGLLRVSLKDTPANTNKFLVTADPITFASPQHTIVDSGSISATQGTSPWVVSLTSTTITGTVAVTQSTSPWIVAGNLTNNNAAPGANNIGTLSALANAANPTWTEADQVLLSEDLSGNLRVKVNTALPAGTNVIGHVIVDSGTIAVTQSTSPWVVSLTSTTITGTVAVTQSTSPWIIAGNKTNNNAVPGATNVGVLPAIANAATQTWVEGDQVLESVDLSGRQRIRGTLTNNNAAPIADQISVLPALCNTSAPTFSNGFQTTLSVDTAGGLRLAAETTKVIGTVNQGTSPWVVSLTSTTITGTVAVTQSTSPWVVSLTSTTITGTVAVTQSTSPWVVSGTVSLSGTTTVIGNLTNNNAAPAATEIGVLPALATAVAPTWNEGDQVLLSVDLKGNQRVQIGDSLTGPVEVQPGIGTTTVPPTFTTAGADNSDAALTVTLSPNSGIPAIVQKISAAGTGSQASLTTPNFGSAITPGNSIVVVIGVGNSGGAGITDTLGNLYTPTVAQANGITLQVAIFYATNVKGGTNAVTVTPNVSTSLDIAAYEVSGIIGVGGGSQQGSVDASASASGSSITPASGAATVLLPNEIAFGGIAIGTANQTPTSFTPWNKDFSLVVGGSPAGLFGLHTFSQPLGAGNTAISLTASIGINEPWATAIVSFKPALFPINGTVSIVGLVGVNGVYNTTVPTPSAGQAVEIQVDSTGSTYVNTEGRKATYRATQTKTTPVTSATVPCFTIRGSATKVVRVTQIRFSMYDVTGSATPSTVSLQRFSTITGGTSSGVSISNNDTNDANATATVTSYSALPTVATPNGGIADAFDYQLTTVSATTAPAPPPYQILFGSQPGTKEFVLRGIGDFLGIIINGVGTTPLCNIMVEWTEE
jgi:hypothetical protein